ncbi:MAG TPA: TonB-dependent receptor [Bryobacteraceae bacterium]|nr:TonB-dependent receptor [Bryobacteraceae bacterium]
MNLRSHPLRNVLATGIWIGLSAGILWGQATNSADVTGSVTDPTGAVVPDVAVTVQDLDKNTERTIATNGSGLYDTGPLVPADRYMLLFKKEGFTTVQRGPMTLSAGVIGLNVQLAVGQASQTVVIQDAAAPLLETSTAEITQTVPQETLDALPQTGGTPDWQSFLAVLPGTRGNGTNNNNPGMGGVSVNGSMPFSNALMDGASTSSPMSNNVINTPIFDTVAEVRMSDSLFSAQYGTGGILYNQISKGGTNQFHGMGYDYFKNTALNAAPFGFNGLAGIKSPIHFNDFGGNIGGPVIKNKVFFFFALENIVNHGSPPVSFIAVPTLAMRQGDFTGLAPIYNPASQTVDPTTNVVTRQPFAGNQIPSSMFDTVAKNIQSYYPAPNRPGTVANGVTTNNYAYQLPSISPKRKYFGRFDADVTSNNRITGSASWNDGPTIGVSPVCPLNCTNSDIFNTTNQLSDYWTISPRTINEARIGFMGEYDLITPDTLAKGYPGKLGLAIGKADVFPAISITNIYGLGPGSPSFANYKENNIDISDQVTLIRGRHILHFGGEVLIFRADSTAWGSINSANLGFTGVYTAGSNVGTLASTSGVAYADFLLGYAKSWSASVSPEYGGRLKNPGVFVQDDFKVNPKLTLNLGLRWEGNTGWSEVHGNERSFDPNIINPATNAPGAMWYGITAANGRTTLQKPAWNNWLPRFGFAYLLGTKTTLRGGFGLYTYPWNVDTYASAGLGNAFTASGNETDSTNNVQPVVILSSDGSTNYQGSKGTAINALYRRAPTTPDAYNGQAVGFNQYTSPVPLLKSWNFTVQRQITNNIIADIGYIGSHGSHLAFTTDVNQVPENKLAPNDAASRPYPEFQSLTGYTTEGISSYHAFQAEVTRRFSGGLLFNFNYTWSHMLDNQDSSGWGSLQGATPYQRAYSPLANYGPSNFDVRHMFKGHAAYDLPLGRGRRWLNNSRILDEAIGGWQLFGDFITQTGSPFTPTMATNNSYALSSNSSWYPNVVGNPTAVAGGQNINSWFNVNAFAAPTPGTFGNLGRNALYGPGLTAVNMSLHKIFSFNERIKLDFSANATNLLNHPSFALPDKLIGPGHFAQITGTSVGSRQMELIAKVRF